MKKILLSLLFLSLCFTSCESDDGITYTTPDYISGTWKFDQIGTINNQNFVLYQNYPNSQTCESDNFVLNTNGTLEINDYTLDGTNCVNAPLAGTFTLVNKDLTFTYTENNVQVTKVYTIISLTYTEMVIVNPNSLGQSVFYKLKR
jgi:hypothetical protein